MEASLTIPNRNSDLYFPISSTNTSVFRSPLTVSSKIRDSKGTNDLQKQSKPKKTKKKKAGHNKHPSLNGELAKPIIWTEQSNAEKAKISQFYGKTQRVSSPVGNKKSTLRSQKKPEEGQNSFSLLRKEVVNEMIRRSVEKSKSNEN